MLMAKCPLTGERAHGKILPRSTFKNHLDKALKPLKGEFDVCVCQVEERDCVCFNAGDLRRIAFRRRLDRLGIPYDEIGTHSVRKGSASHAASGSTHGPPIVAICLRAGWKLGGVLNTYLILENAGDCFVGRVAAGLPLLSPRFTVLPPKFPDYTGDDKTYTREQYDSDWELIDKVLRTMFGNVHQHGQSFKTCLRYALASLCFHKDWLSALPPEHSWHTTWLARNPDVWARLQGLVGPLKYADDDLDKRYVA